VALVGKGLTFDSGGYNLKVGASLIEMMKFDMGGSGAVLGAAKIITELKPANVEVHFVIAACENMVDGAGMRPGDILTASNGKTIEVNNTDAEGRLTLADALVYVERQCQVRNPNPNPNPNKKISIDLTLIP
jgi:leucyl aminopeptidase